MRVVYINNEAIEEHLRSYAHSLETTFVTTSMATAYCVLKQLPLWRRLMEVDTIRATSFKDVETARNIKEGFYPSVRAEVDDDTLVEILLLASPDDVVVYQ